MYTKKTHYFTKNEITTAVGLHKELQSRSTTCVLGRSRIEGKAASFCCGGHLIIKMDVQWFDQKCLAYQGILACLLVAGM
jgi:hypothetical protein